MRLLRTAPAGASSSSAAARLGGAVSEPGTKPVASMGTYILTTQAARADELCSLRVLSPEGTP